MDGIGSRIYALRKARGLTQRELAELAGISVDLVSKLEQGVKQAARLSSLERIADALGVPLPGVLCSEAKPDSAGEQAKGVSETAHSDKFPEPMRTPEGVVTTMGIDRRHLLLGLGAAPLAGGVLQDDQHTRAVPATVGQADVQAVLASIQALKLLDNRVGGGHLCSTALMETRRVWRMVNTSRYSDDVGARLRAAAGELAIFAGWLHYDADRIEGAWNLLTEGMTAARLGANREVEVHAYAQLSLVAGRSGRSRDAVDLARMGQRVAGTSATRRLRSLLFTREALGWSQLGETSNCEQALGRAREAFDPRAAADDPEWISFYNEAELEGLDGGCRDGLRQYEAARSCYQNALDRFPPQYVRNREFFATGYALSSAYAGDIQAATEAGRQTLSAVTELSSTRVRDRVRRLRRCLIERAPTDASVRAFDEHCREVLS